MQCACLGCAPQALGTLYVFVAQLLVLLVVVVAFASWLQIHVVTAVQTAGAA